MPETGGDEPVRASGSSGGGAHRRTPGIKRGQAIAIGGAAVAVIAAGAIAAVTMNGSPSAPPAHQVADIRPTHTARPEHPPKASPTPKPRHTHKPKPKPKPSPTQAPEVPTVAPVQTEPAQPAYSPTSAPQQDCYAPPHPTCTVPAMPTSLNSPIFTDPTVQPTSWPTIVITENP
ncbi:MAG: hypothetical protein ACRDN0_38510 [Trebonia sp.]